MNDRLVKDRKAARVLLMDGTDRVLLLRGGDPRTPEIRYWFTVGGGIEPGEDDAAAAVRELFEETGLGLPSEALRGPVYREVTEFPFDGVDYRQQQVFFAAAVESWEAVRSGFDEQEARDIDAHRWWSAAELAETTETFYPENLIELMGKALAALRG
jgi:8-oxo-dGTP pyrophosphatase MutT (NUDIX family)